jgi:apolipoprotein D and lipocalin family protein
MTNVPADMLRMLMTPSASSRFARAWIVALALCLLPLWALADDKAGAPAPLAAVPAVDLNRYMGTWYEIARFPNRFQKKCVGYVRADYSVNADGTVKVANQCRLASGETDLAIGAARQVGASTSPKLKVRFAPAWLSFIPLVWGDYWIIDLDDAYRLVAVSEPTREYLWILSRTPKLDPAAYEALLGRLHAKGFDLRKLVVTPQG